jgi:transcriptional regulator with XRE-family HTH domain
VRRLHLGRILRELREEAGLSLEVAAPALDWSSSKLSRIENGRQGVDVHGVRTMMDIYGVVGPQWDELLDLTRSVSEKGWWRAFGLDDKGYVPLEAEATLVREATTAYVPGLLQIEAYARAVFAIHQRTAAELDNLTAVRRIRQNRLTSLEDPLELVAVVDEVVLRRPVGGPAVMRPQLAHLVEAAALDRVTLQVLPMSLGAHPGLSAPFTLLTFGGIDFGDMVYVEHPVGAVHISKEDEVAVARLKFDRLRSLARTPTSRWRSSSGWPPRRSGQSEVCRGPQRRPVVHQQLQQQRRRKQLRRGRLPPPRRGRGARHEGPVPGTARPPGGGVERIPSRCARRGVRSSLGEASLPLRVLAAAWHTPAVPGTHARTSASGRGDVCGTA